jgi:hypothetical protein
VGAVHPHIIVHTKARESHAIKQQMQEALVASDQISGLHLEVILHKADLNMLVKIV